jgi:hypothetical protein
LVSNVTDPQNGGAGQPAPLRPVEEPKLKHWEPVDHLWPYSKNEKRNFRRYGHDHYHPKTYSGRIVCYLTTESPIVIGGQQVKTDENQPATVKPVELTPGQPAIPASSLRGLLSSIAEAASNSALRVLDDKEMFYSKYNQKTKKTKKWNLSADCAVNTLIPIKRSYILRDGSEFKLVHTDMYKLPVKKSADFYFLNIPEDEEKKK